MSQTSSLPVFIQEAIDNLQQSVIEEDKLDFIHISTREIVGFLSKLLILQYLQSAQKSSAIDYFLFSHIDPQTPEQWLAILQQLLNYFRQINAPILPLLKQLGDKYPGLRIAATEDRGDERLLWFSKLDQATASTSDIQESYDHVLALAADLHLLAQANYEIFDDQLMMVWNGQKVCLEPLYQLSREANVETIVAKEQSDGRESSLLTAYRYWRNDEYRQFLDAHNGIIDFSTLISRHRQSYVMVPWLQAAIEEIVADIFLWNRPGDFANVILVEGYPNCGKSALVANLPETLTAVTDFVWSYFILPHHPTQSASAFGNWLEKKLESHLPPANSWSEYLSTQRPKIVVAVDGLENMLDDEYRQLVTLTTTFPGNHLAFIFCKRRYERPQISTPHYIELDYRDNVYFEQCFSKEDMAALVAHYAADEFSQRILRLIAVNPPLTVVKIAAALDCFTPKVLGAIRKLQPILKVGKEWLTPETYQPNYSLFADIYQDKASNNNYRGQKTT